MNFSEFSGIYLNFPEFIGIYSSRGNFLIIFRIFSGIFSHFWYFKSFINPNVASGSIQVATQKGNIRGKPFPTLDHPPRTPVNRQANLADPLQISRSDPITKRSCLPYLDNPIVWNHLTLATQPELTFTLVATDLRICNGISVNHCHF